jgi:hypothetical protein
MPFETFRNKLFFTLRVSLPHDQHPSWRTNPCRRSATAYSIYSQLPSVSGGLPSNRYLRMRHALVTRDPLNMAEIFSLMPIFVKLFSVHFFAYIIILSYCTVPQLGGWATG